MLGHGQARLLRYISIFMGILEDRSQWFVKEGNRQEIANTAWACATLGIQSPKLFSEIEKQSSWILKEGRPQAVANTAWACAICDFLRREDELMTELMNHKRSTSY
jgi:hypothetical protein